jgi:hypothetical protein
MSGWQRKTGSARACPMRVPARADPVTHRSVLSGSCVQQSQSEALPGIGRMESQPVLLLSPGAGNTEGSCHLQTRAREEVELQLMQVMINVVRPRGHVEKIHTGCGYVPCR